jgi:hypothetical protein
MNSPNHLLYESAHKYILKAFKKNAFKLNNKKIERLSVFVNLLAVLTTQQQQSSQQ